MLNGQKIWCSFGQIADVGEFLVRTDPDAPKHRGISWLILPMDLPGIEVRPLKTVLGSSEFAEVFLTDVRVAGREPRRRRERRLAGHERHAEVRARHRVRERAGRLDPARAKTSPRMRRATRRRSRRRELGRCIAEFDALWALTKRNVSQATRGTTGSGRDGDEARVLRSAPALRRAVPARRCDRDALHVDDNELVEERLRTLALTIAAGASQIQRNIIGERVLGLPREPR